MAEGDENGSRSMREPLQAIGEALVRTFQNVADEKVPVHLLDLLDRLDAGEPPTDLLTPPLKNGAESTASSRREPRN